MICTEKIYDLLERGLGQMIETEIIFQFQSLHRMELEILALHPSVEPTDTLKPVFKTHGNIEILHEVLFRSKPIININSNDAITFQINSTLKLLSLHLNTHGNFVSVEILADDNQHKIRKLILTNKKSKIIINDKECTIPIKIGASWQYLSVDMKNVMKRAFGVDFNRCLEITIRGGCMVKSCYLHKEDRADVTLPTYLQVFEHV